MAKTFVAFQGKGRWLKNLFEPDLEYGNWSAPIYLNDESYGKFMKLKEPTDTTEGIKNDLKKSEDGNLASFKRPLKKDWKDRNGNIQTIYFDPPLVTDSKGQPWDRKIPVGDGSDLTVTVELYTYAVPFKKGKRGSAIRLDSVRVDNYVPYLRSNFTPEQEKRAGRLDAQPAQLF